MTRATTHPIVLLLLTIMTTGPAAADAPIMVLYPTFDGEQGNP
jgi:hypothetical protein